MTFSIRGGRDIAHVFAELMSFMKESVTVLSELFADETLPHTGMTGATYEIYPKDIACICEADAIIAEVTTTSLGVEYEIAEAETLREPVLSLFHVGDRKPSAMIYGSPHTHKAYSNTIEEAKRAIALFIHSL